MEEKKVPKITKEFLQAQIGRSAVDMERADAVKKFCQFLIENKMYIENDLKEGKDATS